MSICTKILKHGAWLINHRTFQFIVQQVRPTYKLKYKQEELATRF